MGKRTWFKIYADGWLEGSIRDETPLTRAIFVDLMALAASGKYGDEGKIALSVDVGITFFQLTNLFQVSKNQLQTALHNLKKSQRIEVRPNGIISIINWQKYQSEYSRQEKYRIKTVSKVTPQPVTKSYNQELQPKVTTQIEKEIEIKKYIKKSYGEFNNVELSDEELIKLKERFGEPDTLARIARLSNYLASAGKKYKSHYATILNWAQKDPRPNTSKDDDVETMYPLLNP